MNLLFFVCDASNVIDRKNGEILGRIQQPLVAADLWRALVMGQLIEASTQAQLHASIQKQLLADKPDPGEVKASSRISPDDKPQRFRQVINISASRTQTPAESVPAPCRDGERLARISPFKKPGSQVVLPSGTLSKNRSSVAGSF